VLELEPAMTALLRRFRDTRMTGSRVRVHGNFQLSELLYTGSDFVIIDFGGDSTRHFNERRTERSVLWDVVSMRGSLRHAAHSASFGSVPGVNPRAGDLATRQGAELWSRHAGEAFFEAYLAALDCPELLPQTPEQMGALMSTLTLQRELGQADRHMADTNRLVIALRGLAACLHS
jgi:maltose alpha-D-glucosyltransferase / alpha-amylase